VSDTAQGPGWWQAADGTWYPPTPAIQVRTDGSAVTALVLAILSWVLCPIILAIIALVFASTAQKNIDASGGTLGGDGLAKAARIVAILNIVLVGLVIVSIVAIALLGNEASTRFSSIGDSIGSP
jgi:hypothetical protein